MTCDINHMHHNNENEHKVHAAWQHNMHKKKDNTYYTMAKKKMQSHMSNYDARENLLHDITITCTIMIKILLV